MKKIQLAIFFTLFTLFAFAQEKKQYIEVDYVMSFEMDADEVVSQIPKQYRAMVETQIRQEIKDGVTIDYKLKSNGKESIYQMQPRVSNAQGGAGMIYSQIASTDNGDFYKDLESFQYLKAYDFAGMKFLVKDSLPDYKWKMLREKEEIAGFQTRKAEGSLNDTIGMSVWYAPKITIKDGPDRAFGLPGLVLKAEFEVNDTKVIITATNVMVKEEEIEITKPSGGKVLSQKEFEAEMKALQERMREMMEGGVDADE